MTELDKPENMAEEKLVLSENTRYHLSEVRRRVILGNMKLYNAWKTMVDNRQADEESFEAGMSKWVEATQKLRELCYVLQAHDEFNDCLYLEKGVKTRRCLDEPDGSWCIVCPCPTNKYHDAELMGMPPASMKGPPKAGAMLI